MTSKIGRAKICFCLHFANSIFTVIFFALFSLLKKSYFISAIFTKIMWRIPFQKILKTVINLVKNEIFKKVYLPLKPTWRSCFFSFLLARPKPKAEPPNSSRSAKTRSTQSQACVKYMGNIICIKRNTDVNKSDLKNFTINCPNKVDFHEVIFNFIKN